MRHGRYSVARGRDVKGKRTAGIAARWLRLGGLRNRRLFRADCVAGVQAWGTPAACSARYGRRNGCQSRGRARLPPSCRGMRRAIATLLSENVLLPQGWGKQLASKIASSKECGQTFAQQKGWLRPRLVMKVCSSDPRGYRYAAVPARTSTKHQTAPSAKSSPSP